MKLIPDKKNLPIFSDSHSEMYDCTGLSRGPLQKCPFAPNRLDTLVTRLALSPCGLSSLPNLSKVK